MSEAALNSRTGEKHPRCPNCADQDTCDVVELQEDSGKILNVIKETLSCLQRKRGLNGELGNGKSRLLRVKKYFVWDEEEGWVGCAAGVCLAVAVWVGGRM